MPSVAQHSQPRRQYHQGLSEEMTTTTMPQVKRRLEREDVESPSELPPLNKRLKVDGGDAETKSPSPNHVAIRKKIASPSASTSSSSSSNNGKDEAEIDVNSHIVSGRNKDENTRVDPSELASAFALASLAGMSPGSHRDSSDHQESREVKDIVTKDQADEGVRKAESWDEARSPKADQHPVSPEQRSPGSMNIQHETPTESSMDDRSVSSASRKVHFAPNTKETSSPSLAASMKGRLAASRRLVVPPHHRLVPPSPSSHPNPSGANHEMTMSPRPHRMFVPGSPISPFARTPPHLMAHHPNYLRGAPPTPPHPSPYMHPSYPHQRPPHLHHHRLPPGVFHPHLSAHHPPPPLHFAGGPHGSMQSWSFPPSGNGPRPSVGYPHIPRQLLQPPLLHHPGTPGQMMGGPSHHAAAMAAMERQQHEHHKAAAAAAAAVAAAEAEQNQWICDYCNVASFGTYEEACLHEETCKARQVCKTSSDGGDAGPESSVSASRSLISMSRSRSDASTGEEDASMAGEHHPRYTRQGGVPSSHLTTSHQQWHQGKMSLAIEESDQEWLSELNCFIRSHCVEVFSATEDDVNQSSKRGRITLHQVGIRCCFCSHLPPSGNAIAGRDNIESDNDSTDGGEVPSNRGVAAVSFPTTVSGIYESVKRWQRVHLEVCEHVPATVRDRLNALGNTNVWVPTTRQYWADAARALGLVDTEGGIRFSEDPISVKGDVKRIAKVPSGEGPGVEHIPPHYQHHLPRFPGGEVIPMGAPSGLTHLRHAAFDVSSRGGRPRPSSPTDALDSMSAKPARAGASQLPPLASHQQQSQQQQRQVETLGGYIIFPHDMEMIPPYVYFLMRQVEPCLFTEADRFVARSKGPVGYPGFQCRHCNGHAGLGKYFPVSSKSLSTNSTSQNIHAHLLKCRKCPDPVKDRLVQLKVEKSRAPRLEPGWRKVFFDKVWARLHRDQPQVQNDGSDSSTEE
jgi:hypothetical protein